MQFLIKTLVSALMIAGISEVAKRSSIFGALIASLPLTSLLAFIWLYYDTQNNQKIIDLSYGIFWLVIPSLALFLILPLLLKSGVRFWWALPMATVGTALVYFVFIGALKKVGLSGQ